MKKTLTILLSLLFAGTAVLAQNEEGEKIEVSVRIAPLISIPRVLNETSDWDANKGKSNIKFSGGVVVDRFLQENVALSFGLWYTSKRTTFDFEQKSLNVKGLADYNLQYVEIPFLVKGLTNNVTEKIKIYVQAGVTLGVKIGEKYAGDRKNRPTSKTFAKGYTSSFLAGAGVEYNIGTSNKIYAGLDFNQGLTNIIKSDYLADVKRSDGTAINKDDLPATSDFKIKNTYLALVLGFKF